jgi:cell wall-associated NlpC family hydrolase
MPPALADVAARISGIEGRFRPQALRPLGSAAMANATTDAAGASDAAAASFADVLDRTMASVTSPAAGAAVLPAPVAGRTLGTGVPATIGASPAVPTAMGAASPPATGTAVVQEAMRYLGTPYVFGSDDPAVGLDCSGLTRVVFARFGIDLPHYTGAQVQLGQPVASLADARPGDVLFFGSDVHHEAIYLGNGLMLHAPRTGDVVGTERVWPDLVAIRRFTAAPGDAGRVPFADAAARTGVPANLLAGVARVESSFRPDAVSPVGAQGLMQLMPGTAQSLGVTDPFDPAQSVDGAARLLRALLDQFGSVPLALAAYNAGAGAVRRAGGVPSPGVQR